MTRTTSPIGRAADEVHAKRVANDPLYRAEEQRLAPYRVIAESVMYARARHGLTQKQLAKRIGTTDSVISRIESGDHPVSLATLTKLGEALGIAYHIGGQATGDNVVVVPGRAIDESASMGSHAPSKRSGAPAIS